eukprot:2146177-Pleurochrysis_carterae.AAC.1
MLLLLLRAARASHQPLCLAGVEEPTLLGVEELDVLARPGGGDDRLGHVDEEDVARAALHGHLGCPRGRLPQAHVARAVAHTQHALVGAQVDRIGLR